MKYFLLILLLTTACSVESLDRLGLYDQPTETLTVDLLCDPSPGAPASEEHVEQLLLTVLPVIGSQPGSQLRLWVLGNTMGQTRMVHNEATAPSNNHSARLQRAAGKQFQRVALPILLSAYQNHQLPLSQSPLLEAVAKIAAADTSTTNRVILLLTDAREYSALADMECGPLPEPQEFLSDLHEARILTPGSLEGVTLVFAFVSLDEIPGNRCRLTMAQAAATTELWKTVMGAAGARRVVFRAGNIDLSDLEVSL